MISETEFKFCAFTDTKEFEALPWNIPENKKSAGDITDIHVRLNICFQNGLKILQKVHM